MSPLEESVRSLTPGALRIYKQQLPQRLKQLGELERNTALEQLGGIPELSDIFQQQPVTTKVPQQTVQPARQTPLQTGLQAFAAPFQWISEHVTEPFGAITMARATPSVAGGKPGESWLERERREYEQWDEPEFTMPWGGKFRPTKGIVETLPWLAIPGIGGVGARAAGVAGKAAAGRGIAGALGRMGTAGRVAGTALEYSPWGLTEKVAGQALRVAGKGVSKVIPKAPVIEEAMAKVGQWTLPSKDLLNTAYLGNNIRRFAQWAENKPVAGNVFRALGGEKIFVKEAPQTVEDIVQREIINRARLQEIGVNMQGANMPRLTSIGDPIKFLRIADDGIVNSAIPKTAGGSRYLNDILENPDAYKFANREAEQYIKEFSLIRKDQAKLLADEGLKQSPKVHRIVKGIVTEDGKYVESKFGSDPSLTRIYETQEEAALAHLQKGQKIVYGVNPNEIMQYEFDRTINRIARKRFAEEVGKFGKKPIEKFAEIYPEKATGIANLTERQTAAQNALDVVQRILSYKATSIPGGTIAKINRELPDMAGRIRILFELKPDSVDRVISQMGRELRVALKTQPTELKKTVKVISDVNATWRDIPGITMLDIEDAIKSLNIANDVKARMIIAGYKETNKANRQFFKDFMLTNRDELNRIIDETKIAASPLKKDRSRFLAGYAGRERLPHVAGEVTERPFNRIPEFKGKFFPDNIVTYLEKNYSDEGNQWIRNMGSISAMSRNLTAVLDDSAPFIQGLFLFGRNPIMWGKTTARQLEFLVQPKNFERYMAKPEVQALHAEMVKYGSSVQRFEMVEALPQIERLVGRIPKVGGTAQRVVQETYGRAEAAFTGFGQLARDNLWKSLKRPDMPEAQLQELARTLDIMTGNLSTKAMGVAATQRDLESAFVFFSPRFTRASLAFIGDMFKGGIAGAEARKSIFGLMAAGSAMYLGVCKATGQEPDFNPRSGRFMTIKVGDDYVGIGGMLYSLARLAGNLTTVDDPMDLIKLDRFDNPFIKFMYGKAAPLTGLAVGALEQKNYYGQPFESPADWGRFLSEKVLPFSVAPLVVEKEKPGPASFAAQFAGMRVFPKSPYELRDEERQNKAQEQHGVDFTSLTKLEQNKIDKLPEVQKLTDRIREEGRETPESIAWDNWNKEGESIEMTYRREATLASKEYQATGNGLVFRDKVDEAKSNKRSNYAQRASNPQYTSIQDYFNTPRSPEALSKMNPLDIAREEYYRLMYSPDMYDQYGNYNFDLADQKEMMFLQKYGQQSLDYVQEYTGSRWDEPTPLKELKEARNILKPYWDIESQEWAKYPPEMKRTSDEQKNLMNRDPIAAKRMLFQYPQIAFARRRIALLKKQLKLRNPQVAQALALFY